MTLTNEKRIIRHEGNGATTNFPYDFLIPDANSVIVSLWDEATDTTTVLNPSQYNITGLGDPNFGEVTYPLSGSPIAAGTWLVIEREVAYTQDLLIKNQGGFFADSTMAQLDRIVMQTQQLAEMLERTPKFSPGSGVSNRRITQGDEGTALIWDAAGNIVEGPSTTEIESAQTYATVAKAAAALAQAGAGAPVFSTKSIAEAYSPDTAPDFIETAGYSTAGDGGGALYKKVASEPSHAGKFSITLDDGVTVVWYEIAEQVLTERMFGAPCDGEFGAATEVGTDATTMLQAWADCPVSNRKRFTGVSRVTAGIKFPAGTILEGDGLHTGVTGRAIVGSYTEAALIVIDGIDGLSKLNAVLTSSPSRGDTRLVLDDTSELREGDWVCLYNPTDYSWSAARPTYREGEWVQIEHIESATEVYLMNPLWHGYNASDMDIYVLRSPQSIARNFRVETPAEDYKLGLKIIGSIGPIVDNVKADGLSTYGCIGLERCVGNLRVNGSAWQGQDDTSNNEYGLVISSCHGGQIHGNFSAMRHGIAFGNSDYVCCVPNRLITVYANSGGAGTVGSIDFGHGCSEGLTLVGGTHSGLSLGGANHRFVNCRFVKGVPWADGIAHGLIASGSEFVQGDFTFDGCEFIGYGNPITTGTGGPAPVNFALGAATTGDCRFIFNDCIFDVDPTVAYAIRIQVTANHSYKPELIIKNPKIRRGDALTQFARLQAINDAVEFGLVSITGVEGLGPTVPRCIFTGTVTASRWVFDPQKGTVSVAGNTGASSVNAAVSFPWAYPNGVTPFVQAWMRNASIGGDRCIVIAASVSNTGFTATAMTADTANFANTDSGTVAWRAEVG